MVDAQCKTCATVRVDTLMRDTGFIAPCQECGADMEPLSTTSRPSATTPAVAPDSIPGGMWIRHGICNIDGTPRRYDSFSEMRKEAKARGLYNVVEHETDPSSGSDKNKHTQRFVGLPASLTQADEDARVAAWWANEKLEGYAPPAPPTQETGIRMGGSNDPHANTKAIIKAHI
jgi:hypothetical protein